MESFNLVGRSVMGLAVRSILLLVPSRGSFAGIKRAGGRGETLDEWGSRSGRSGAEVRKRRWGKAASHLKNNFFASRPRPQGPTQKP